MKDYIQPIHKSNQGLFNARSGKLINFLVPKPEMILLDDIAFALANICRFGGHVERYTVAEHSLLVWQLCPPAYKPAALLHDASEAYLGDVIKPLKNILGEAYEKLERTFTEIIFNKYDVPLEYLKGVKPYDTLALEIENNYFRFGNQDLIKYQYEYRTALGWYDKPYDQFLSLLNHEFLQKEIQFHA